ncbi:MAG: alpha-galactosidase, partial [Humibacter sp.]
RGMTETIDWGNQGIRLRLHVDDDGRVALTDVTTPDAPASQLALAASLNPVELLVAGDALPQGSRHVELGTTLALRYRGHETSEVDATQTLTLVQCTGDGVSVASSWTVYGDLPVLRCTTVVTNESERPVVLEYVSSFAFNGFARFASPGWQDETSLWIPNSTFSAEFQWNEHRLPSLGIIDPGFVEHVGPASKQRVSVLSVGTQPTTEYLPMGAFTDRSRDLTWLWQIEHNGSWQWELGDHRAAIYLSAGGPTDQEHQWHKTLMPGDRFEAVPVAVACARGELVDAFVPLTDYRRRIRRPNDDNVALPVVFNDFMNALVAEPTEAKLLPVIEAAAAVGCEYFCVDAGWYSDETGWWDTVGGWEESPERFPNGFVAVFDAIRDRGMIPGLWLEPEVVGIHSPILDRFPDSAFFQHNGARVVSQGRHQLDFRSEFVRSRMDAVVDRLIADYGLGYLKFDYNINGGVGTEVRADSAGDGLLEHNRAFLSWIDGLFARHPGLVIESCSSGGARVDYATLARHSILSTSDQMDHRVYVPIAAGAPTALTPEQAGVWVYPQPEFAKGELALSIVNGLLARPQISGGIWKLSAGQLDSLAEGIRVYKDYRELIPDATPWWPLGLPGWTDAWIAQALTTEEGVLIAVWRRGGESSVRLDFTGRGIQQQTPRVLFPSDTDALLGWTRDGVLEVTLPEVPSAVLFALDIG